jgi:glycosyltransferase involved in cell wall biosynthesis
LALLEVVEVTTGACGTIATRRQAPDPALRILIDYRPALENRTGAGEYIHQLVGALAREHRGISVFSSSWKTRLRQAPGEQVGVFDRRIPVRLLNLMWHRLEWPPVELLTGAAFDVVHSPHPLLLPARRAAQVVTIHDLDFLHNPGRTGAEIRRDYGPLAKPHAARADAIVVPSRSTAHAVIDELGADADRVCLCPPGAPPWPARESWPDRGPILFLGTIEPRKNLDALLQAYESILARYPLAPDLVIAGKPTPEAAGTVEALARASRSGKVQMKGYVPEAERRALFSSASVFVMPSLDEGFGMPVLEAMTVGVPVVVSNRGALPEVVGDAGLLVDPTDVAQLASAIARIVTDRTLAERLSSAGIARARQFTWATTARAALQAYNKAVEHRRARG